MIYKFPQHEVSCLKPNLARNQALENNINSYEYSENIDKKKDDGYEMETFILKAYDLCNIGRTNEHKAWLHKFAEHVQKHIAKDVSSQSHLDIALDILQSLTILTTKAKPNVKKDSDNGESNLDDDDGDDDGGDSEGAQRQNLYQLLSISDLTKKDGICSGQLVYEDGMQAMVNEEMPLADYKTLVPIVPSFLLGYLTWGPSQSSETPVCGSLFLEDNSGCLPIEIPNPDKSCLGQLILVPGWTYVPATSTATHTATSTGYIEATTSCILASVKVCNSNPTSMSVPSSLSLSEYKQCQSTGKQKCFNLHGEVTAISPVHSMFKSKPFFFVELTCTLNSISTTIVIQGAQLMHWFQFLHVGSEYVFTDLRETTMNKKTRNERKILATTRTSKFIDYSSQGEPEKNVRKRKPVSNEDVLPAQNLVSKRLKGSDGNPQVPMVHAADQDHCRAVPKPAQPKKICYSGIITRCFPQPHVGCYELDNKVRLYTVHQPCPYMGRGMRVGAEVSLYNVHPVKKGKDFLGLCCCTLSTLRVTKHSPLDSDWKPSVFSTSPFALHGQNMSLLEFDSFTHACEKLLAKFSRTERPNTLIGYSSSRHKRLPDNQSIIEKLLHECKSKLALPHQPRNIYQEFFDHPHTCFPTRKDAINIQTIYSIEELKQLVLDKSKELPWQTGNGEVPSRTSEWAYQVINCGIIVEKMVLLGHLKSSSTTGLMKLCDQTAKLPLHVGIAQNCHSNKSEETSRLLDCKDCIIQINNFDVVIETFQGCILQSFAGEKRTRIYLRTTWESIEQLSPKKSILEGEKAKANTFEKDENKDEKCDNSEKPQSSTRNEKIQSFAASSTKKPTKDFDPDRSRDQAITCTESLPTCLFTCKILFLVRHRENLQLKKKRSVHYACAVDIKVLAFSSNEIRGFEDVANDVSRMLVKSKSVVLRIQSESLILHPYLFEGRFYVLTESVSNKDKSLVMRALNSASRTILNVTPSMSVTPVCLPRHDVTDGCHANLQKDVTGEAMELGEACHSRDSKQIDGTTEGCHATGDSKKRIDCVTESCHAIDDASKQQACVTADCNATDFRKQRDDVTETCHAIDDASKQQASVTAECHATETCHASECKRDVVLAMTTARGRFLSAEEDKLQSVEEVLNASINKLTNNASKNEVKQVNFQGVIILRELRQSDTCGQLLPGKNVMVPRFGALEESIVQQLELGFGYLGNKTLFLRVQDLCSPNTLDVYVDLSTAPYLDGLLPGAVVSCRRFVRKVSRKGNVYCSYEACSSLTAIALKDDQNDTSSAVTSEPDHQTKRMSTVPHRFLVDLITSETSGRRIQTISRIRCRVTSVQKLWMRWQCPRCSHVIVREECPQGCRSEAPFRFCAEARCLVEDGTAEALVYIADDMIAFLLKLSANELSRLKSFALSLGELLYQRYSYGYQGDDKSDNANLLSKQCEADRLLAERCCSQQIKRSVILYCKSVGSFNKKTDAGDQEYDTRPIMINQTEHSTFVLPKLQLKAVNMTGVDYQDEIKHLLNTVNNL